MRASTLTIRYGQPIPGGDATPKVTAGHAVGFLKTVTGDPPFLLTLPVVFHCVWSLGFEDGSTRVLVHSVAGCVFYGVFAAKILALRLPGLPSVAVPVLGGLLAGVLVVVWFSSAFWFFGQSGYASY